jgi:hypothetical protein
MCVTLINGSWSLQKTWERTSEANRGSLKQSERGTVLVLIASSACVHAKNQTGNATLYNGLGLAVQSWWINWKTMRVCHWSKCSWIEARERQRCTGSGCKVLNYRKQVLQAVSSKYWMQLNANVASMYNNWKSIKTFLWCWCFNRAGKKALSHGLLHVYHEAVDQKLWVKAATAISFTSFRSVTPKTN